jgi:BASS family bile acid:Na+ symporter
MSLRAKLLALPVKFINWITALFPLWAVLFSLWAFNRPASVGEYKDAIFPLLAVIMFGMGMTLTGADFRRVLLRPWIIGLGVALQYLVMPLAAYLISKALALSPALLVGMVLVGSASGGTASNVICYLARGDVALSISLTLVSTLLAIVATPWLTQFYAGATVHVPALQILYTIAQLIVLPVLGGVLINRFLGRFLKPILPLFPLISVAAIVFIIGIIVAINHARIGSVGFAVLVAVMAHNLIGLLLGYWLPRALRRDKTICRTLAIEVGMQNSGMAVALAIKYFSATAALPGALFSIWHNLSGSLLAGIWARKI